MIGFCAYCFERKTLSRSHAIPNAFFRDIKKAGNGQLVISPGNDEPLRFSQDTADSYILCSDCESAFNQRFDKHFIYNIRKWNEGILERGLGYRHAVSAPLIAQSILSVAWRGCVSGNTFYDPARINWRDIKMLRAIIDGDPKHTLKKSSLSVFRLFDKTTGEGACSQEILSQIILPIQATQLYSKGMPVNAAFGFDIVFYGFFFRAIIPRLRHKTLSKAEYVKSDQKTILAVPMDFKNYAPLRSGILHAVGKQHLGDTKF